MLKWNDKALRSYVDKKNKTGIKRACEMLSNDIKLSMKTTPRQIKMGRKAQKKGKGGKPVFHHASAPGFPPAVDIGQLINSISYKYSWGGGKGSGEDSVSTPKAGRSELVGVVGTGVEEGWWRALEYGTVQAGRHRNITIQARPFLRPALIRNRENIARKFK